MPNQRGTSHLPIILALFFGAAVVVTIFGYMLWPKDEEIVSTSSIDTNKVVNANATNGNTNATNVNATADATKDWKTYENTDLGFSFKYPVEYGNVKLEYSNGDTGKKFSGSFTATRSVIFGGSTTDFGVGRTMGLVGNDTLGYAQEGNKYYYLCCLQQKTEITDPVTVIKAEGVTGILIAGGRNDAIGGPNHLPDTFGAVFNLQNVTYPGISFLGGHYDNISRESFEQLVNTFRITNPTAGWKTYADSENGFSFRYPKELVQSTPSGVVTFKGDDSEMSLGIINRVLDPDHILDVQGEQTIKSQVSVGSQTGYLYTNGDGPCSGEYVQTDLQGKNILRIAFPSCYEEANKFRTDTELRNRVLGTFSFTN